MSSIHTSPQKFAEQLGLMGDKRYIYLLEKPEERLEAARRTWQEVMDAEEDRSTSFSFHSEFASLFLPEFLEAYLLYRTDQFEAASVYSALFGRLVWMPLFARYMRVHPRRQVVFEAFLSLLEIDQEAVEHSSLAHLATIIIVLQSVLVCILHSAGIDPEHPPLDSPLLPPPSSPFPQQFAKIREDLRLNPELLSELPPDLKSTEELIQQGVVVVSFLNGSKSPNEILADFKGWQDLFPMHIPWIMCAAAPSLGRDMCPRIGNVEMMACGRCLSVRYCCKNHQRADWKEHKRICFVPKW